MTRVLASFASLVAFVLVGLVARPARAEVRTYVIAIGNNQPLPGSSESLRPLEYADDDAADFFTTMRDLATDARLLAVLDTGSQRRFPLAARVARPPSLAELRQVVTEYRGRFEEDRRGGHEPVLLFFFSGHGAREPGQAPSLAMLDGPLTQATLYDEILAKLPARFVHLLVDACHAEAIVRPRDASAPAVDLGADDVRSLAARSTLDRFPHVGAVVAAASAAQAHEWDVYQRGVFTHEVLSGLRGAADVDGDGRVEYSELSAFLAAANREVRDARARLDVVVRPPSIDRRAAIVDLSRMTGTARLVGAAASLGAFSVEDTLGNRLADVHAEAGSRISIALPANQTLFLRAAGGEATLNLRAGARVAIDGIVLVASTIHVRGAMDDALRRGLFASPFGPVYYRGFVDSQSGELVPVPQDEAPDPGGDVFRAPIPPATKPRTAGWIVTSLGAGAGVAAAVFGVLALDARGDATSAHVERTATEADSRFESRRGIAIGLGAAALVGIGIGTWLLTRPVHAP